MNNLEYNARAIEVAEIIDIAMSTFKKYPPEEFTSSHIDQFINTYLDFKKKALNPEPKFQNLKSLKQIENDALIYFQEGSGKAVTEFWKEVAQKRMSLKRSNNLIKILKRGKIKNRAEYDKVIDTYNSYLETNSLSVDEVNKLNDLISKFEKQ